MSASYGNYLTEEDPNKKKPEGTTPSMAPTTATGGTTTPPLGIDGFVGTGTGSNAYQTNVGFYNDQYNTAVDTAKTNRDLGYEYAEGVKNSIYGNAAAQRAEADKNTEVARQRGIIDSQSSYQKAVGAYGSNAETLAGRGLSGSGYGEYLTADAYATHRGQVQNINADALRANREAAYAEKQAQMAADSEYLKNIYGIKTEYNNAMNKAESDKTTGMYQAALGLNEDQNAAYGKLFDSASKGVSLDAIMQDGTWGDLTPEQQQAITAEAERFANDKSVNEFKGLIDGGTSLEEIQQSEAWSKLTPAQQTDVTNYYNNKQSGDALETDSNYLGLLSDINSGALTIGAIKNTTMWNTLSKPQQAQLEAAATLRGKTETKDRMGVYADLAAKGVSLEDIKTMMEINGDKYVEELTPEKYEKLSDEEKAAYNEARNFMKLIESGGKTYAAAQKKLESKDRPSQIAGLADLAAKGYSIDEIKQWAAIYGITELGDNELAVIQSSADRYASAQEQLNSENEMDRALGYVGLLEAGWTLKDVKALIGTEAWNAMGTEARNMITKSSEVIGNLKTEAANKDAKGALAAYIEAAGEGLSIDAITAIAMANGHYDVLVGTKIEEGTEEGTEEGKTLWDAVTSEANAYTQENQTAEENEAFIGSVNNVLESGGGLDELKNIDGFDDWTGVERDEAIRKASDNTINSMLTKGASLDEIKNSEAWATASTAVKDRVEAYYKEEAEIDEGTAITVLDEFDGLNLTQSSSIDNLDEFLNSYTDGNGKPLSDRIKNRVRAKWIDRNVKEVTDGIVGAKFQNGRLVYGSDDISAEDIKNGVINGMFGDKAGEVVTKYLDTLKTTANNTSTKLADIVAVQGMLTDLRDDLRTNGGYQSLVNMVDKALGALTRKVRTYDNETVGETKINGETYTTFNGVAVKPYSEALRSGNLYNQLNAVGSKSKYVRVGNKMYARVSNVWYAYDIVES